ncbi:hypothetical protein [Pseudomonas sp. NCCP-436]|uniref:hypothetical protein n=1 Tax=Pseudomonas sp. NCCP-436 TaxID=2842481 RepID=UPI001C813C58|nr:hypothetical protein [Pseudomonas sp. NCCP-436]
MHLPRSAVLLLVCACSPLAGAQQAITTPPSAAPGSATPQPYGQPLGPALIRRQGSTPLLPPLPVSAQPDERSGVSGDRPLPLLEEQLRRNGRGSPTQHRQD